MGHVRAYVYECVGGVRWLGETLFGKVGALLHAFCVCVVHLLGADADLYGVLVKCVVCSVWARERLGCAYLG